MTRHEAESLKQGTPIFIFNRSNFTVKQDVFIEVYFNDFCEMAKTQNGKSLVCIADMHTAPEAAQAQVNKSCAVFIQWAEEYIEKLKIEIEKKKLLIK